MNKDDKILVCGAGGFIGGHLVKRLVDDGFQYIRAVDIKSFHEWNQIVYGNKSVHNHRYELRDYDDCYDAVRDMDYIFNLAANMGGMGFIEHNKADCMLNVLINTNLLCATTKMSFIKRYFFSSTACVYRSDKQDSPDVAPLKESDAYPAMPEDGYGWEKLFSERMCRHFMEDYDLEVRIARLHNVYGPNCTYDGGREKAPAAICRKVIEAVHSGNHEIEIWGDGTRTRSFQYIDDCVEGILRIMDSDIKEPINLGSSELVTINKLVDIAENIGGFDLKRNYDLSKPQGVHGRNSDNTLIKKYLNWEPDTPLETGLKITFDWINNAMTLEKF